jgi:hypothetical protein
VPLLGRSRLCDVPTEGGRFDRYVYFPGTAPVPEWQAVVTRGRSFVIGALVDIPDGDVQGGSSQAETRSALE